MIETCGAAESEEVDRQRRAPRAVEILGQRWTILVLRDLLVGPRRYSDLLVGLPGIPTNVLANRLKELEADGLVVREARAGSARSVVYRRPIPARRLHGHLHCALQRRPPALRPIARPRGWRSPTRSERQSPTSKQWSRSLDRGVHYEFTLGRMKTLTIRTDIAVEHALESLTRDGQSRSEATRAAILAAERAQRRARLRAEAEQLRNDRDDVAASRQLAAEMDAIRAW